IPGRSGTSLTVIFASSRANATPEMTAFSIAMCGSSSKVISVPDCASWDTGNSGSVRLESTRVGTLYLPANSTERICSTLEPAPAHLEYFLEGVGARPARLGHGAGVGGVAAAAVGVEVALAALGPRRGRPRRRVRPAATKRGHIA